MRLVTAVELGNPECVCDVMYRAVRMNEQERKATEREGMLAVAILENKKEVVGRGSTRRNERVALPFFTASILPSASIS